MQVMRINEMITKDKMSWCLIKSSWLVPYVESSLESMQADTAAWHSVSVRWGWSFLRNKMYPNINR